LSKACPKFEIARFLNVFADHRRISEEAQVGLCRTSAIPEPSAWAMLLMGIAGLAVAGYWRASAGRAAALA
jgi:hypothetical protein